MPVINETTYHEATDLRVVDILEKARLSGQRLNIRYGDRDTGRDWGVGRMVGLDRQEHGDVEDPASDLDLALARRSRAPRALHRPHRRLAGRPRALPAPQLQRWPAPGTVPSTLARLMTTLGDPRGYALKIEPCPPRSFFGSFKKVCA